MKSFRPVFFISVCFLLIGLSACGLAGAPNFKQNLVALYVTTFNPIHQKNVPKLKNAKITDKKDIKKLYSILLQSRKAPNGQLNCPAGTGVYYKLRFESKNNHVTIMVHPTGCAFIKIPQMKTRILWGKSGQTFMKILAKDLHVSVHDLGGYFEP